MLDKAEPQSYSLAMNTLPNVAVDVVIFTLYYADLWVCLVQRQSAPYAGCWALPGSFVQVGEALDDLARHQFQEKTGVCEGYLQQLYTFGDPQRDPRRRVISVTYFALVSNERLPSGALEDCQNGVGWHSMYRLPPLAFDHSAILDYALTRLRYKIEYSAVAFELMPEEFTLRELQQAYMVILDDQTLDQANFRKKIHEAGIVEPVSRYRETGGRPAKLYRFRKDAEFETKARRFFP
jgi:8-oxo-dGTP diphosphatase